MTRSAMASCWVAWSSRTATSPARQGQGTVFSGRVTGVLVAVRRAPCPAFSRLRGNFSFPPHVSQGMASLQTTIRRVGARRAGKAAGTLVVLLVAGMAAAARSSSTADPVAAAKPTCGGSSPKLTVQGTGLATGTPNILTVYVGIDVTDPTAQAALADDNTRAGAVTAVLTQGGVATKDVQTTDVSINPTTTTKGSSPATRSRTP